MKRIRAITGLIAYGDIADIGTGDGIISIHALETGRAKRSIACDLNPEPLSIAKQNADNRGYTIEIEFRLAFGLERLEPGEAQTVIVAGMGGQTMSGIIDRAGSALASAGGIEQLILQPQSDCPGVRRSVHRAGFEIIDEILVKERHKYYLIMDCRRGGDMAYSEADYLLGRFLPRRGGAVFLEYLEREIAKMDKILSGLCAGERSRARYEVIKNDLDIMRKCICK